MLLKGSACEFITAQQFSWWLKGGEGGVRGGRKGGGEAVGPALPALGPALASNCNSSSGVKSAQPGCLSPPQNVFPSVLAFILKPSVWLSLRLDSLPLLICTVFFFLWKLQAIWLSRSNYRAPLFCPLWVVSSVFTPPNGKSGRLSGVNMWALPGLKYHPLPGKQWWRRQPCRLVTSLFFDPPTFL